MFSFLNNIPTVTRNLLILNVLLFTLTWLMSLNGYDLELLLSSHAINSPLFEPFQIVSHAFMHVDPLHLFMNMFGLVLFGGFLEKLWGQKRFFIFFFAACVGAWIFNAVFEYIELSDLEASLRSFGWRDEEFIVIRDKALKDPYHIYFSGDGSALDTTYKHYQSALRQSSMGASGGIFGILAAFAILFPNTELSLLFIPVPVKAKFLIGFFVLYEISQVLYPRADDNVGHLAHIGGAIVGAIFVLVWRKSRTNFY